MNAWTGKYIITGIMIGCMFLLPMATPAFGDEKATGKQGVESTIDQLRADEHELTLKIQGCQWQIDRYTKEARVIAKEQAEYSKSLEAVKKEIAAREVKGEPKK